MLEPMALVARLLPGLKTLLHTLSLCGVVGVVGVVGVPGLTTVGIVNDLSIILLLPSPISFHKH